MGARFEDVLRAAIAAVPHPDAAGREEAWLAERLALHREMQSTHEQRLPGDRWLRVEERRTADGGSIGVRIDITELKRREASFRLLFEDNPLPMYVFDVESLRFIAVNETALAHYGYSREQFLAMTVLDIRPVEDRPRFMAALAAFDDYHAAENWRHRRADGTIFDADIYSRKLHYGGRLARFSVVLDITERRRAERERDRNREFLDLIVENVPSIIVVKDARDMRYVLVNKAGEADFGIPRSRIIGKTVHELFPRRAPKSLQRWIGSCCSPATDLWLPSMRSRRPARASASGSRNGSSSATIAASRNICWRSSTTSPSGDTWKRSATATASSSIASSRTCR